MEMQNLHSTPTMHQLKSVNMQNLLDDFNADLGIDTEPYFFRKYSKKVGRKPSNSALALGNCQGFYQGESVFSLMSVSKIVPRQNCLKNMLIFR